MDCHRLRVVNFDTSVQINSNAKPRRERISSTNKVNDTIHHVVQGHQKEISLGSGDGLVPKTDSESILPKETSFAPGSKSKRAVPQTLDKSNKKRIRFQSSSLFKFNKTSYIPRNKSTKSSSIGRETKRRKYVRRNQQNKRNNNIQVLFTQERSVSPWNVKRLRTPGRITTDRNRNNLIYGNSNSSHDIYGFKGALLNPYLYYQFSQSDYGCNLYQALKNKLKMRKKKGVNKCCSHLPLKVMRSASLRDMKSDSSCRCPSQRSWCAYNVVNLCENPSSRMYGKKTDAPDTCTHPVCTDQATGSSPRVSSKKNICENVDVGTSDISFKTVKQGYDTLIRKLSKHKCIETERKISTMKEIANEFSKGRKVIEGNVTSYLTNNFYSKHRDKAQNLVKSILLGFFVIIWSPCVLVAILGWALASPLKPANVMSTRHKKSAQCKPCRPTGPSLSTLTHKFSDAYKGLLALLMGNNEHHNNPKCPNKRTRGCHNLDPNRKNSLSYTNNRARMVKPMCHDTERKSRNVKFNKCCTHSRSSSHETNNRAAKMASQSKCQIKKEKVEYINRKTSTCITSPRQECAHIHSGREPNTDHPLSSRCGLLTKSTQVHQQPLLRKNIPDNTYSRNSCNVVEHDLPEKLSCVCTDILSSNQKKYGHSDCSCSPPKCERPRVTIVEQKPSKQEKINTCQQHKIHNTPKDNVCPCTCDNLATQDALISCQSFEVCKKYSDTKSINKLDKFIRYINSRFSRLGRKSQDSQSKLKISCKNPDISVLNTKIKKPIPSESCKKQLDPKTDSNVIQCTSNPNNDSCKCLNTAAHNRENNQIKSCQRHQCLNFKSDTKVVQTKSKSNTEPCCCFHNPENKTPKAKPSKDKKTKSQLTNSLPDPKPCSCLLQLNKTKHEANITKPNPNKTFESDKSFHRCDIKCKYLGSRYQTNSPRSRAHDAPSACLNCMIPNQNNKALNLEKQLHRCNIKCRSHKPSGLEQTIGKIHEIATQFSIPDKSGAQTMSRGVDVSCVSANIQTLNQCNKKIESDNRFHRCHIKCRSKHINSFEEKLNKFCEIATQFDRSAIKVNSKQNKTYCPAQVEGKQRNRNRNTASNCPIDIKSCPFNVPQHFGTRTRSKSVNSRQTKLMKKKNGEFGFLGALSSRYYGNTSEPNIAKSMFRKSPLDYTLSKLHKLARRYDLPASRVVDQTPPKSNPRPSCKQISFNKCAQSIFERHLSKSKLKQKHPQSIVECKQSKSKLKQDFPTVQGKQSESKLKQNCPRLIVESKPSDSKLKQNYPQSTVQGKPSESKLKQACPQPIVESKQSDSKLIPSPSSNEIELVKKPDTLPGPCMPLTPITRRKSAKRSCTTTGFSRMNRRINEKKKKREGKVGFSCQRFLSLNHMTTVSKQLFPRVTSDRTNPCLLRNYQCSRSKQIMNKPTKPKLPQTKVIVGCEGCKNPDIGIEVRKKKPEKCKRIKIKTKKCRPTKKPKIKRKSHNKRGQGMCVKIKRLFKNILFFDKAAWPTDTVSCRDIYVYTLREKPWFWVYQKYPKAYPCFLSWYRFYQSTCKLMIYSVASAIWCPLFFFLYCCVNVCCKCFC